MSETVQLGDVAQINPKGPARGELHADEVCDFVPMAGIYEDGTMEVLEQRPYHQVAKGYTAFRSGDVLLAKITPCFENGKISVAETTTKYAFGSTEFHVIRPKNGNLNARYLFYFLRQSRIRTDGQNHMTGSAGQKRVPRSFLDRLEIPLPDIEQQCRIAAILDKADEIRRERDQSRALARDLLRSAFLEMFGDPATNPRGFNIEVIAEHLSKGRAGTQSGPFGSALKKREYVEEGIPVWGVDNVQHNEFVATTKLFITEDKYEQLKRYRVLSGDVLISRAGTVGRMCIAKPPVDRSIISTNLVRVALNTDSVLPEYFVALFTFVPHRLGALKANNKDSAFTFLNPKTLRGLQIPIPPIDLQVQFKRLSENVESHIARLNVQLEGFDELFSSLSQRAFRGEL